MSKDAVADWDATAGNNTDIGGINIDEGWAASAMNNALRAMMAQIKTFTTGATFAGDGAPVVINSTNSNTNKIVLQNAGVTIGYIGVSATGITFADSSGTVLYTLRLSDGQIRAGPGSAAEPVLVASTDANTGIYFDGGLAVAIDGTRKFRVQTDGDLEAIGAYDKTTGSAANLFIDSGGVFYRSTSALKYKANRQDITDEQVDAWLSFDGFTYASTADPDGRRYFGFAADEADAAGLTELVTRDGEGNIESYEYGRDMTLAKAAIKRILARLDALEA